MQLQFVGVEYVVPFGVFEVSQHLDREGVPALTRSAEGVKVILYYNKRIHDGH